MVRSVGKLSFRFIRSMKFGLFLLGLLAVISALGSLVPQGRNEVFYYNHFSRISAALITFLKIHDIYHSFFFIAISAALSINLLLCSVVRLFSAIKKIKYTPSLSTMKEIHSYPLQEENVENNMIIKPFHQYGFKKFQTIGKNQGEVFTARKNLVGYLGSWFIHTGVLIIILFYAYGCLSYFSTSIYGLPGDIQPVSGTSFSAEIKDFNIDYREDQTIRQYTTNLILRGNSGDILQSAAIQVNHPMRYNGYSFYQTSTGWTANLTILKGETTMIQKVIYEGTAYEAEENITLHFTRFLPDFSTTESGFFSHSNQLHHPKILCTVFHNGQQAAMNLASPGESFEWNGYKIIFSDPKMYTYLQINKTPGKSGVLAGACLLVLGLFITFYIRPLEMIIIKEANILQVFGNHNILDRFAEENEYAC